MTKEQLRQNFASNLKHIRKELNMNQEQFSHYTSVKRGNLASIEEGRSLSIESAISISKAVKISLDTLLLTDMKK